MNRAGGTMNERIDVLAVMDAACDKFNWADAAAEMAEARAAVAELIESLRIAEQALLEVAHAQANGPSWYTRGESGMRAQVDMWVRKGLDATGSAIARVQGGAE